MKKIYLPLMGIALCLTLSVTVMATARPVITFDGSTNDKWSTASNWNLNRLPANGDSIVIPNGKTAYVSGTSTSFTLSNVVIVVQQGGTLQIGNGTSGVLALDNSSAVSLESNGTHNRAQLTADNSWDNNNKLTIGGVTKFVGGTIYTTNSGSGFGVVTGPARATSTTGNGAQGFSFGSLPVVLVGFAANLTSDNKVNIQWTTQQEINTDHFEIQRSNDGLNWDVLTTVKAAGYSSIPENYSCSDAAPQKGINFYQMRIIDLDGNYGFSPVVNVRLNTLGKVSLFPNPSVSSVTISLSQAPASDWTVSLVNISGQVMLRKQFSKDQTTVNLPVSSFPTGNYTVEIADGSSVQHAKLMITHQ